MKILIVDDDDFLSDMYALKFREAGFEVEAVSNGDAALEILRGMERPDALLIDGIMPQADGFAILATVKKEKLMEGKPIVLLTNLWHRSDIEKGLRMGASDYFVKMHHTPSQIVEKVKLLLSKKK